MENMPKTLAGLLKIVLMDCRKYDRYVQSEPELYGWDMNLWLEERDEDEPCRACMWGSAMYFRDWRSGGPYLNYADAVDHVRTGDFHDAWHTFHGNPENYEGDTPIKVSRSILEVEELFERLHKENEKKGLKYPSQTLSWDQFDQIAAKLEEFNL